MKSFRSGCIVCLVLALLIPHLLGNGLEKGEIRVLLTTGGHDFQQRPFFAMFDELPGVSYTHIQLPESASLLKPGLEKKYDVIVRYDMVESISQSQRRSFTALLKKGIGMVSLHHNLGAHRYWPEFARIIGGKYVFTPQRLGGKEAGASSFAHDQDLDVEVRVENHPITQGVSNFRIHDETYKDYYTASDVEVLLTTDHPRSDREIAWVTRYGRSRVCYLLLGHDSQAWKHPAFSRLLLNAIRWAASHGEPTFPLPGKAR